MFLDLDSQPFLKAIGAKPFGWRDVCSVTVSRNKSGVTLENQTHSNIGRNYNVSTNSKQEVIRGKHGVVLSLSFRDIQRAGEYL